MLAVTLKVASVPRIGAALRLHGIVGADPTRIVKTQGGGAQASYAVQLTVVVPPGRRCQRAERKLRWGWCHRANGTV